MVLLLLMLGLEYTASDLVSNLRTQYPAGLVDAALNALPGAAMALLLGRGPIAAVVLAGITWISSSGVIAKVLGDLGRIGNRETPVILSILVLEDLPMAVYLPVVTALLAGTGLAAGSVTLAVALGVAGLVLLLAVRYGRHVSRFVSSDDPEKLLLVVLGLTLLVAGVAQQLQVSKAVGAFLVGIALSGEVAEGAHNLLAPLRDLSAAVFFVFFGLHTDPASIPPVLLPALALAVVTTLTKIATGYWAARRAGISARGRWRAGGTRPGASSPSSSPVLPSPRASTPTSVRWPRRTSSSWWSSAADRPLDRAGRPAAQRPAGPPCRTGRRTVRGRGALGGHRAPAAGPGLGGAALTGPPQPDSLPPRP